MAVGVPKLRLLVGGVLIEGVQVPLEELPAADQGGAAELVRFLGGARRVLVLRQPLIYRGDEPLETRYLVVRQDEIQACEFVTPEQPETDAAAPDAFRWEWDE